MSNSRKFVLCGHRGNMADSPENTLLSFASAERAGVDEIELDVRFTRDGVAVILHDRTVARTAATSSPHLHTPIENLTFKQVRSIDLGGGEQIPTLNEALDATTVLLQVEIKAAGVGRALAEALRGRPQTDQARCLVTSFDPLSLSDFMGELTYLERGTAFHVPYPSSNWRDHAYRLGISTVLFPLEVLERSVVDELHDAGYRVGGSLIEGPGEVRRVLELDVDTSSSNAPEYARHLLRSSEQFTERFPSFISDPAELTPATV